MIDKVILGTVQLGMLYGLNKSKISTDESLEILDLAYNSNIFTYDTTKYETPTSICLSKCSCIFMYII